MTTKTVIKSARMDTKELREALQKVNSIPHNRALPALNNILMEFANGKAVLTTTDLERAIKVEIDSTNNKAFSILLPKKTTEKFLLGVNGKVSIAQDASQGLLSRDGIGDLNLVTSPVSDFPPIPPMPDNLDWHSMDGKWLCSMLRIVSTACAEEFQSPVLTGIACNDGKMAAADGYRLVAFRDSRLAFGLKDKQAIIPRETIKLVNKLFHKSETIEIAFETKEETSLSETKIYPVRVYFKSGNVLITSQLRQGTYPQYDQLIPERFNCKVSFSAPLLSQRLSMIDETALVSGFTRYIFKTSKQGEQLCSLSEGIDSKSQYHLTCPVKFEGDESEIAFNLKYIVEAIKPFSVCTLELTSESSPVKFTGDIEGLTIVVMPMFV